MSKQQHPFPKVAHYRIFSANMATDLGLSELPRGTAEAPLYRALRLAPGQRAPAATRCFRRWEAADRTLVMTGDYIDDGFVLSFPDVAEFVVRVADGAIRYHGVGAVSAVEIGQLLIGQVLPRLLAQQGRLVLHASTVRIGHRALCFLGPSTSGKSTLASALHVRGYEAMGDDAVMVQRAGEEWLCVPAYPGLRLWPDSLLRLMPKGPATRSGCAGPDKQRILLTGSNSADSDGPVALAAIFVLDAKPGESQTKIGIERLAPIAAVARFLVESFKLDTGDAAHMRSQMAQMAALSTAVPVYRLRYPRVYEQLPEVCRQVVSVIS